MPREGEPEEEHRREEYFDTKKIPEGKGRVVGAGILIPAYPDIRIPSRGSFQKSTCVKLATCSHVQLQVAKATL